MKVQSMFIGKPKQLGDANATDKMQQAWCLQLIVIVLMVVLLIY